MNKLFIFDMDGVIANTEEAYIDAFRNLGHNIKIDKKRWFNEFPGTGPHYVISTLFEENNYKSTEKIEYWIDLWKKEYESIIKKGDIKPIEGFLNFNKQLNDINIPKIIATGSHTKNALLVLQLFNIVDEFDIVGSEDVKARKPNPDLFLEAARRLDYQPKDCIVFEDSLVGIQAAKAAGMKCVAVASTFSRDILEKENPDLIINNYVDVNPKDILNYIK